VLDDIDPEFIAPNAAMAVFFNQGEACVAGSRAYFPARVIMRWSSVSST
jgi:acyl-CoA reductase-like NAD-dependent aldehyde dehydrogenase